MYCPRCGVDNKDTNAACWNCFAQMKSAAPEKAKKPEKPPKPEKVKKGRGAPEPIEAAEPVIPAPIPEPITIPAPEAEAEIAPVASESAFIVPGLAEPESTEPEPSPLPEPEPFDLSQWDNAPVIELETATEPSTFHVAEPVIEPEPVVEAEPEPISTAKTFDLDNMVAEPVVPEPAPFVPIEAAEPQAVNLIEETEPFGQSNVIDLGAALEPEAKQDIFIPGLGFVPPEEDDSSFQIGDPNAFDLGASDDEPDFGGKGKGKPGK